MKAYPDQNFAGALAHICLVNHSETKDNSLNGHISPTSANAQNDDSDEDKDEDGGNIEGEAPEGKFAPGSFRTKWLTVRSYKEEEEEEAQEEERRGQRQQDTDRASESSSLESVSNWSVS